MPGHAWLDPWEDATHSHVCGVVWASQGLGLMLPSLWDSRKVDSRLECPHSEGGFFSGWQWRALSTRCAWAARRHEGLEEEPHPDVSIGQPQSVVSAKVDTPLGFLSLPFVFLTRTPSSSRIFKSFLLIEGFLKEFCDGGFLPLFLLTSCHSLLTCSMLVGTPNTNLVGEASEGCHIRCALCADLDRVRYRGWCAPTRAAETISGGHATNSNSPCAVLPSEGLQLQKLLHSVFSWGFTVHSSDWRGGLCLPTPATPGSWGCELVVIPSQGSGRSGQRRGGLSPNLKKARRQEKKVSFKKSSWFWVYFPKQPFLHFGGSLLTLAQLINFQSARSKNLVSLKVPNPQIILWD